MTDAIVVKPPKRAKAWDLALTIVLMTLTVAAGVIGGISVLVSTGFTDYCPPTTCHPGVGLGEVFVVWVVTTVIVLALWAVAVVLLVRRRRGWWLAAIALVIVILAIILEFVVYAHAVGYF